MVAAATSTTSLATARLKMKQALEKDGVGIQASYV
jgi:hypothetical protein